MLVILKRQSSEAGNVNYGRYLSTQRTKCLLDSSKCLRLEAYNSFLITNDVVINQLVGLFLMVVPGMVSFKQVLLLDHCSCF